MKALVHTMYRRGQAGLSNLIMSLELGVVMARLTDRVLILVGNNTPPANVVRYEGILTNTHPSRVTDLLEVPVPWLGEDGVNLAAFAPRELCNGPAFDAVFYYPPDLSLDSEDFLRFAGERRRFVTIGDELDAVPALAFSGGSGGNTLSFYSTFFYLDADSQRRAFDALRGMSPKRELADFATRVAHDLGPFNAVHVRRGDFKLTFGTTTLDRSGRDVVEALEPHFSRDDRLIILTDETDDPIFEEIRLAYPDAVFLDHHILNNYRHDFLDLPAHDSIALAFLSQLVAAESRDFVGSMTSTFTSMIQRMRGNRGKDERFKFLWNELPDADDRLDRGRHRISDSVPLDKGVMVDVHQGPFSWNRVNARINTAWMREWPESFLCEDAMVKRARGREISRSGAGCTLSFCSDVIAVSSNNAGVARDLANLFAPMIVRSGASPIAKVHLQVLEDSARLLVDGVVVSDARRASELLRRCYREVVSLYVERHPELVWLHAGCAAAQGQAVILPGDWGRGKTSLVLALCERGWSYFSDDVAPVNVAAGKVLPFPATPQVRSSTSADVRRIDLGTLPKSAASLDAYLVAAAPLPLSMIVLPHYKKGAAAELLDISPAEAVAELLESCLSFAKHEDAAVQRLCTLVEKLPVYRLVFQKADDAAALLIKRFGSAPEPDISPNSTDGARSQMSQDVTVGVTLVGGVSYQTVLPADSQILHDLHVALATRSNSQAEAHDSILQLPMDGGHTACTFMSSSLLSLTTRPPVLLKPLDATGAYRSHFAAAPSYLRIEDFLTPRENELLLKYAVEQEAAYHQSSTLDGRKSHRRSKVLHAIRDSHWKELFFSRLKLHLPQIADALGKPGFCLADSEMQLTASNDGDYFKAHPNSSPAHPETAGREITFVYYLHRAPRPYSGGGLLLYEGAPGQPAYDRGANVSLVDPQNNCLIAFTSDRWHEVDMVRCPSGEFADSRFTVNGWLRQQAAPA